TERMRANLDSSRGQVMAEAVSMALARKIGKADAHQLLEEAVKKAIGEKRHLQLVLAEDERVTAHLSADEIARLFEPLTYQGTAPQLIDRLVAAAQGRPLRR